MLFLVVISFTTVVQWKQNENQKTKQKKTNQKQEKIPII